MPHIKDLYLGSRPVQTSSLTYKLYEVLEALDNPRGSTYNEIRALLRANIDGWRGKGMPTKKQILHALSGMVYTGYIERIDDKYNEGSWRIRRLKHVEEPQEQPLELKRRDDKPVPIKEETRVYVKYSHIAALVAGYGIVTAILLFIF